METLPSVHIGHAGHAMVTVDPRTGTKNVINFKWETNAIELWCKKNITVEKDPCHFGPTIRTLTDLAQSRHYFFRQNLLNLSL